MMAELEVYEPLHVGLIAATVRQPDERLLAILLADRALTPEERAYVDAAERGGVNDRHPRQMPNQSGAHVRHGQGAP